MHSTAGPSSSSHVHPSSPPLVPSPSPRVFSFEGLSAVSVNSYSHKRLRVEKLEQIMVGGVTKDMTGVVSTQVGFSTQTVTPPPIAISTAEEQQESNSLPAPAVQQALSPTSASADGIGHNTQAQAQHTGEKNKEQQKQTDAGKAAGKHVPAASSSSSSSSSSSVAPPLSRASSLNNKTSPVSGHRRRSAEQQQNISPSTTGNAASTGVAANTVADSHTHKRSKLTSKLNASISASTSMDTDEAEPDPVLPTAALPPKNTLLKYFNSSASAASTSASVISAHAPGSNTNHNYSTPISPITDTGEDIIEMETEQERQQKQINNTSKSKHKSNTDKTNASSSSSSSSGTASTSSSTSSSLSDLKDREWKQRVEALEKRESELADRERLLRHKESEWHQRLSREQAAEQQLIFHRDKLRPLLRDMFKSWYLCQRSVEDKELWMNQWKIGRLERTIHGQDQWKDGVVVIELKERRARLNIELQEKQKVRRKIAAAITRSKQAKSKEEQNKANTAEEDATTSTTTTTNNTTTSSTPAPAGNNASMNSEFVKPAPISLSDQEHDLDLCDHRIQQYREELVAVEQELMRYEATKKLMCKSIKLKKDEYESRFHLADTLVQGRYILLNMLGKGGFSEVFHAFDTQLLQYVAIKIHQLDMKWNVEKCENYMKHAERECEIHKRLRHRNVVPLLERFNLNQIDTDHSSTHNKSITIHTQTGAAGGAGAGASSTAAAGGATGSTSSSSSSTPFGFITVLQYCDSHDLDTKLRERNTLSEREARLIIRQVFTALQYFARQGIIHFDLKPANILFHQQDIVKITDFGLSKIFHLPAAEQQRGVWDHSIHIELTSQGAGTYWYQAPECFPYANTLSPTLATDPTLQLLSAAHQGGQSGGGGVSGTGVIPETARISNKVDVFSAGVILYQMLTGKKPFGHGESPAVLLHQNIMRNANPNSIQWPDNISISDVTKEFIRKCLSQSPADRPNVEHVFNDPYFQTPKTKK